jgi:hypothetical protein
MDVVGSAHEPDQTCVFPNIFSAEKRGVVEEHCGRKSSARRRKVITTIWSDITKQLITSR